MKPVKKACNSLQSSNLATVMISSAASAYYAGIECFIAGWKSGSFTDRFVLVAINLKLSSARTHFKKAVALKGTPPPF